MHYATTRSLLFASVSAPLNITARVSPHLSEYGMESQVKLVIIRNDQRWFLIFYAHRFVFMTPIQPDHLMSTQNAVCRLITKGVLTAER